MERRPVAIKLFIIPSLLHQFSSVQSLSCVQLFATPWTAALQASLSIVNSGLISEFRMDWLDLLAVQGPLKSLLQNRSAKASILRRSAFFIVQLSHPYIVYVRQEKRLPLALS